jgi:hypothetical protein
MFWFTIAALASQSAIAQPAHDAVAPAQLLRENLMVFRDGDGSLQAVKTGPYRE